MARNKHMQESNNKNNILSALILLIVLYVVIRLCIALASASNKKIFDEALSEKNETVNEIEIESQETNNIETNIIDIDNNEITNTIFTNIINEIIYSNEIE